MKPRKICTRWTAVGLALTVVACLAQPLAAGEHSVGIAFAGSGDAYDYPVRPGTDAWRALETHEEMVRVSQVAEAELAVMSDRGLLQTVLDYPLLVDVMVYNSPQQGLDAVRSKFNGLQRLLERGSMPGHLLRRYQRMDASEVPAVLSLREQGRRAGRIAFVELLLAQPEVLAGLSDAEREELALETLLKREQKLERFEVYGLTGLERTALAAGRAYRSIAPDSMEIESLGAFLDTGVAPTVRALDTVFARVEEALLGTSSPSLSERAALLGKDYNSYVYTPNGTAVPVIVRTWELSSGQIAGCNSDLDQAYPNATRLTNCSRKYNCHSYAWYSQSPFNNRWMNTPGDDTYWQDGSYIPASIRAGRKVSYASDDHSAIALSGSEYESKWGSTALMRHAPTYTPYNSSVLNGYRLAPDPEVVVSGPISREPNESGTWTCSASGGEPPYTYSWFKSWDGGGYQDLGTGSSKTTSHPTSFNIVCDVTEADGTFLGTDFIFVDVDGDPGPIFE